MRHWRWSGYGAGGSQYEAQPMDERVSEGEDAELDDAEDFEAEDSEVDDEGTLEEEEVVLYFTVFSQPLALSPEIPRTNILLS